MIVRVALVGDHDPAVTAHRAIPAALRIAAHRVGCELIPTWVHTATIDPAGSRLAGFAAVWCVPASPYASTDGALAAIRFARETGRPFLGTCGGFQHAVLEYARNVLGITSAEHAETAPDAATLVISRLTCSLVEKSGRVFFPDGSRLRVVYGAADADETYHCNYGLNPAFEQTLFAGPGLGAAARDAAGDVRAIELAGHPFFVGTLFQPERSGLRGEEHPLVTAFVEAAAKGGTVL